MCREVAAHVAVQAVLSKEMYKELLELLKKSEAAASPVLCGVRVRDRTSVQRGVLLTGALLGAA